jgi:hypothetical protein
VKQRGNDMEEALSSIIDRRAATIAFLREALLEGAVSCGELELKAREAGLLGRFESITHAKLLKEAKKVLGIRSVRTGFGPSGEWGWELAGLPPAPTTASAVQLAKAGVGTADTYAAASSGIGHAQASHGRATSESRISWEWTEGVARLDYHHAPAGIRLHRWRQFVDDCARFLDSTHNGAARAATLGWDTYALFGCGPAHPLDHLGSAGLLWFINGGRIVELHRGWAILEVPGRESRISYDCQRSDTPNGRLPWELTRLSKRGTLAL